MVEDVVRLVDHLHLEKAHIIGYSMGGGHATNIGLNHPETFFYVGGMSGYTGQAGIQKFLGEKQQ